MPLTDYKFWFVRRDDEGKITEVAVRFYEGDIVTEDQIIQGETKSVTYYKRLKRLEKVDLPHFKKRKVRKEMNGSEAIVFTAEDFGEISTDEELCSFLNQEIKKDKKREVVDAQK